MNERRVFVGAALMGGAGLLSSLAFGVEKKKAGEEEDVSPAEDLMREHGVLKRVLLVYDDVGWRLRAGEEMPLETLADAAGVIRTFIEGYHEKLEEDHLFPRFRRAHKQVELVDTLQAQHEAGRRLTERILQLAKPPTLKSTEDRGKLADALAAFVRMYAPHEAREDTVLFPAFRKLVKGNEYDALGEEFEKKEHRLFGEDGFEKMVDRVAGIEKKLGLYDLARFTPKI